MKFSIVTPNYNYGRFLGKALESVLAQADVPGAPEIEHVVIDGGSKDGSVAILEKWAASAAERPATKAGRYSFSFVSEPDKGQTDAINKGLRRATGDVVAWLNADEWYLPGKLAAVASFFASHPKADFVYGEPLFVREDGTPIRVKRDHWFSKFVLLCHGCHIASCCSFWRKELLEKDGYLDPAFKVAMDYEYFCRLVRRGRKFVFVPAIVGAFAWHDGNISSEFSERGRVEVSAVKSSGTDAFAAICKKRVGEAVLGFAGHQWRRALVLARLATRPAERWRPSPSAGEREAAGACNPAMAEVSRNG